MQLEMKLCKALGVLVLLTLTRIPTVRSELDGQILQGWLDVLYKDITQLPLWGIKSGVLCFGPSAYPLFVPNSHSSDVIMAAAALGQGKVLAVGSDKMMAKFGGEKEDGWSIFHKNIKLWFTNGESEDNSIVCKPTDSASLSSCLSDRSKRVLVWTSGDWPSSEENQAVTDWVAAGNGLVHAFAEWWKQPRTHSIMEVGFYPVVLAAGIAYEGRKMQKMERRVHVNNSVHSAANLVSLNLIEVAKKLTYENVADDVILGRLMTQVEEQQQYFPVEVSSRVLAPFVEFAVQTESMMTWPRGSYDDTTATVDATVHDHAMFRLYYVLAMAHLWKDKAPNVDFFPGDIADPPATESTEIYYEGGSKHEEYGSVGYYLLPGQEMTITINNDEGDDSWTHFSIMIGSMPTVKDKAEKLLRWPNIKRLVALTSRHMTVRWMFGGLLTIYSPPTTFSLLKCTISGVIKSPYVSLSDQSTTADWANRRQAPGLYAHINSRFMSFTIPSYSVRNWQKPWRALQDYDSMVHSGYQLYAVPKEKQRVEWLTTDIQVATPVRSGYPIVTDLSYADPQSDKFLFNGIWEDKKWDIIHEFARNLPHDFWKWKGTKDVNNNVLALYVTELMGGWDYRDWPMRKLEKYFMGPTLKKWLENPSFDTLGKHLLVAYSQLIRDFGWGCLEEVYESYWIDESTIGKEPLPTDDLGKQQEWVMRWSHWAGYNLCPFFDFWKFPLTNDTRQTLAAMTPYFPDDVITQMTVAQPLTDSILQKYPGADREVLKTTLCRRASFRTYDMMQLAKEELENPDDYFDGNSAYNDDYYMFGDFL